MPDHFGRARANLPRHAKSQIAGQQLIHIATNLRLNLTLTDELELTDDGTDIDREWIGVDLNQFDDQELEQAVLLQ